VINVTLCRIRVVRLNLLEIAKLVQSKDAELPKLLVVLLAFFQCNFTADDLIPRGGVSREFNAAYEELLSLINIDAQRHRLVFIKSRVRNRSKVDVATAAVELAQILQALGDFFAAE